MTSTTRKIIVDSRYFSSGNASNGTFEIPEDIEIAGHEALYLQSFHMIASWLSIDYSNNQFRIVEEQTNGVTRGRTISISQAPYDTDSLASQLQAQLNANDKTVLGTYSVTRVSSGDPSVASSASASSRYYRITLSGGGEEFLIPDDVELASSVFYYDWTTLWQGAPYDVNNLHSTNELFSFANPNGATTHVSNLVDLRSKHAIYLHSTNIGGLQSAGATAQMATCIAVIPCDVSFGGLVNFTGSGNPFDYIDPGTRSLRRITLELRSSKGDLIDTQNGRYICVFVVGNRP